MQTVRLRRDRLEALCTLYGLADQQRLADHLGLNPSTVSRVLASPPKSGPSALFIAAALNAFGVPFEHLFDVQDAVTALPGEMAERVPA